MDEAALCRQTGGRETMHAQPQQLIDRSTLPKVTLLVMPDELGAHADLSGPLAILQFETSTRPVVYVEGQQVTSTWRKTTVSGAASRPCTTSSPPRRPRAIPCAHPAGGQGDET